MKLFGKNKKEKEKKKSDITPEEFRNVDAKETGEADSQSARETGRHIDMSKFRNFEYGVLRGFYISEKASLLNSLNQYVFKVFDKVTKNEVRKQVEKSFNVKVTGVKIINLPRKTRKVGQHSGFKPGFKKAIVVLEKGYSIEQAKV